jgi:hypothetical protein
MRPFERMRPDCAIRRLLSNFGRVGCDRVRRVRQVRQVRQVRRVRQVHQVRRVLRVRRVRQVRERGGTRVAHRRAWPYDIIRN